MNRRLRLPLYLALAFALLSGVATARQAAPAQRPTNSPALLSYSSGLVILKLKANLPNNRGEVRFRLSAIDGIMQQIGAVSRRPLFPMADYRGPAPEEVLRDLTEDEKQGFDRTYVVRYHGPQDAKWVSEQLAATGFVEFAEPYYIFPVEMNPDDPQAASQYWLTVIKAQQAWDVTQGDSSVVIAIIDSGVDWRHEDLAANIWQNPGETGQDGQGTDRRSNGVDDDLNGYVDDWHGWDLVGNPTMQELYSGVWYPDNDPAPRPMNVNGYTGYHGTTVAGCAAASTNNGKGIAAPGYRSKLLAVKCAADTNIMAVNAGYDGIRYAVDIGANIINCSFGGPGPETPPAALQQISDYALSRSALIVAASGNTGTNNNIAPHYPSQLRGVLSVGATGMTDYADTSYTNHGMNIGVYAPGTNILTTAPGNQYASNGVTGTSFSSPVVAGVAALVYARNLDWRPEQIALQLRITGDRVKINSSRFGPQYYRRVNAFRAVTINSDLEAASGTMPGLVLSAYRQNNRTRDSIRSADDVMDLELTFSNLLAPASGVVIDSWPGQMFKVVEPVTLPDIPTAGTATVNVSVMVDPDATERFADGTPDLVLRATKGEYEDVFSVPVPVRLPGFRLQAYMGGSSGTYETHDISVPTPQVAWAVANLEGRTPTWSRTINGRTWNSFRSITSSNEPAYCVAAIDGDNAWAATSPSSGATGVWRTTNGGTAWTKVSVSSITAFVNSLHFWTAEEGILLGDPASGRWGIARTTDGGATWRAISPSVTAGSGEAGWNTSYAAFGDNLWFGTNNNRIFRSTDRGLTWTSSATPSTSAFGLAFTSDTEGIAVFKRTVVNNAYVGTYMTARTTDGGATWQQIQLPFGMVGDDATAIPNTSRILVTTESGILETTDLGATWTLIAAPSTVFNWKQREIAARFPAGTNIEAAADAEATTVGAFGINNAGRIYGYTESPAAGVDDADGSEIGLSLLEPWPNPTTSESTIVFHMPVAADATLALFDASGREVRILADGQRPAGRHAVVLDAAGLAAGTYYCVLTAGADRVTTPVVVVR